MIDLLGLPRHLFRAESATRYAVGWAARRPGHRAADLGGRRRRPRHRLRDRGRASGPRRRGRVRLLRDVVAGGRRDPRADHDVPRPARGVQQRAGGGWGDPLPQQPQWSLAAAGVAPGLGQRGCRTHLRRAHRAGGAVGAVPQPDRHRPSEPTVAGRPAEPDRRPVPDHRTARPGGGRGDRPVRARQPRLQVPLGPGASGRDGRAAGGRSTWSGEERPTSCSARSPRT